MKGSSRRKLIEKYAGKGLRGKLRSLRSRVLKKLKPLEKKIPVRLRVNENTIVNIIAAVLLIFLVIYIKGLIFDTPKKGNINADNIAAFSFSPDTFTSIRELSEKYSIDFYEMLSLYCMECSFYQSKEVNIRTKEEIEQAFVVNYKVIKNSYKSKTIKQYSEMLKNTLEEVKYFPIMEDAGDGASRDLDYIYSDSWGSVREYKGTRKHEGCDILDRENIRGRIAVCSMTDGVIENIGWNELGGYRLGIKTASGTYYYYAHLDRFAEGLEQGGTVTAGQLIGFMGDTGYGKKEGSKGNFAVHLHVGIMPDSKIKKDFWINPYPFLRYIESQKSGYSIQN